MQVMAVWLEMNGWHWSNALPGPFVCGRLRVVQQKTVAIKQAHEPTHLGLLASDLKAEQLTLGHAAFPCRILWNWNRIKNFCSVYGHLSMWSTFFGFLFHSYPHIQYSICLLLKSKWFSGLGVHFSLSELPLCDILACHHQHLLFIWRSILARICPSFWAYCREQQRHRLVVTLH